MWLMPNQTVTQFQSMALEMNLSGLITDREFSILEALTEGMTRDSDALELTRMLTPDNMDTDIEDCIIAKEFTTAVLILW